MLKELSAPEIHEIYEKYMASDFPAAELKPLSMILDGVAEKRYSCYGLMEGQDVLGYAFVAFAGKNYLLDYLAVRADVRDRGYGSLILKELCDTLAGCSAIMIEVENPSYATESAEKEMQEKRIAFYLRNGARDTGVRALLFGVEYRLLEIGFEREHTADEAEEIYCSVMRGLLPEKWYKAYLEIHER